MVHWCLVLKLELLSVLVIHPSLGKIKDTFEHVCLK